MIFDTMPDFKSQFSILFRGTERWDDEKQSVGGSALIGAFERGAR